MNLDNNFINIQQAERDKSIYRIVSLGRLFDIFKNRKLMLVQPKLWDDPYENCILQGKFFFSGVGMVSIAYRSKFYGSCWTLHDETDAMWRIYAPNKDGVKIKTSINKLFNSLLDTRNNLHFKDRECFIGKVTYETEAGIVDFFHRLSTSDDKKLLFVDRTMISQVMTLLIKREAFVHEKEVRLIYYDQQNECRNRRNGCCEEIFQYEIQPESLFEEIIFDPRMDIGKYKQVSECFQQKFSWDLPIKQSTLYRYPSFIK